MLKYSLTLENNLTTVCDFGFWGEFFLKNRICCLFIHIEVNFHCIVGRIQSSQRCSHLISGIWEYVNLTWK